MLRKNFAPGVYGCISQDAESCPNLVLEIDRRVWRHVTGGFQDVASWEVVKVIWCKAASLPHTDECTPHPVNPNRHRPRTGATPAESPDMSGHVLSRPLFDLTILPLHAWGSGPCK